MRTRYRFDRYEFDPESGEVTSADGVLALKPQTSCLLEALLARAGEVVSREELYRTLWPETKVEFDLGLNAAVRALRSALGDDASQPRYVETLRRRGYRWIAPVQVVRRGASVAPAGRRLRVRRLWAVPLTAAALLVLLGWWGRTPLATGRGDAVEPELVQLRYVLDHGDRDEIRRAIGELETLSPELRDSDRGLALAAMLQHADGHLDEAEEAARASLALNDSQVDASRILGLIHLFRDRDPERARTVLKSALDRAPESSESLHAYGLVLAAEGRFREAMRAMRQAVALDPVSPNLTLDGWLVAYLARDFTTSRAWCDDLGRLTGTDVSRCHLLSALGAGQRAQAAEIARRSLDEGRLLVARPEEFPERVLAEYWSWDLRRPREGLSEESRAFAEARALAQLGRLEEAMDRLEVAASADVPAMVFAAHYPYFDPLRGHPRFRSVVAAEPRREEAQ